MTTTPLLRRLRGLLGIALICAYAAAFLTPHAHNKVLGSEATSSMVNRCQPASALDRWLPVVIRRQRRSVGVVQTMGLFGLGAAEITVILVAAAFLLGPQKLAELGKDAGKIAGELKEVPKEFRKGLEEGESEFRSRKAKVMQDVPPEIGPGNGNGSDD